MTSDDMELVREYATHNSQEAFAELVARYVNLVYSVALRQLRDAHLAEEVTQASFIILARKSGALGPKTILAAWLCRTAQYAAADAARTQRRRQHHEHEAYMQSRLNGPETDSAAWTRIAPLLDDAMLGLGAKDHSAIVLRFFENKNFKQVGAAFGVSENAAKRRVSRALEKLRKFFVKRGVTLSNAAIAGAVSTNSIQAAPVALAKTATSIALANGAAASSSTLTLIQGTLKIMAWTKLKTAALVGVGVLLAAGTTTVEVKMIMRPEPSYQGKPVSFWIQSLATSREQAETALEKIGMPSLPYLVAAFEKKDNPSAKVWFGRWTAASADANKFVSEPIPWETIHGPVTETIGFIGSQQRWSDGAGDGLTTPQLSHAVQILAGGLNDADVGERISCSQALAFIGPNSREAGPALVKMYEGGDSKEMVFACQALGTIGPCPTAQQSVQVLLAGLTSQDDRLTESVATTLGQIGSQSAAATPALAELLTHSDEGVRDSAVRALARIGNVPNAARARLQLMLNETNLFIRAGAAVALLNLDPNEAAAMSAVKDCLTLDKPANLRSSTVYLIMGSKPLTELFLDDLHRLEVDPDPMVVIFTHKALKQMAQKPMS